MTLKHGSILHRWAYAHPLTLGTRVFDKKWDTFSTGYQTSLCALFWRSIALAPVMHLVGVVVFLVVGVVGGAGLLVRGLIRRVTTEAFRKDFSSRFKARVGLMADTIEAKFENSSTVAAIGRAKRKVCPLIRIESEWN